MLRRPIFTEHSIISNIILLSLIFSFMYFKLQYFLLLGKITIFCSRYCKKLVVNIIKALNMFTYIRFLTNLNLLFENGLTIILFSPLQEKHTQTRFHSCCFAKNYIP